MMLPQDVFLQFGGGGAGGQEARSHIMYSRIFSCGLKSVVHWLGNTCPLVLGGVVLLLAILATWKSLKMSCPHWLVAPTGVLNVKCSTSGVPKPLNPCPFAR